jgi:hypothetical protein
MSHKIIYEKVFCKLKVARRRGRREKRRKRKKEKKPSTIEWSLYQLLSCLFT